LIVSPDDLSEVVEALARQKDGLSTALDNPPTPRVPFETKNQINNMSVDYAKEQRKKYLKETTLIATFLAAPENKDLLQLYDSAVDEFQLKIIAKRKDYQSFDDVMEYLLDLLFARDAVLRQRGHKRLTRAMLFFMYWNCDIGEANDVAAN
jgi:type II secretory pathway component PulL